MNVQKNHLKMLLKGINNLKYYNIMKISIQNNAVLYTTSCSINGSGRSLV